MSRSRARCIPCKLVALRCSNVLIELQPRHDPFLEVDYITLKAGDEQKHALRGHEEVTMMLRVRLREDHLVLT